VRAALLLLTVVTAATIVAAGPLGAQQPARTARQPVRGTAPTSLSALQRDLNAQVRAAQVAGNWGVMVVSVTRGDTLFARDVDTPMLPASTMKLYTAAIVFERYGPAHQFRTEVLHDGIIGPDGILDGNLYLKGAGDPSLSPRYAPWHNGARPLDALADRIVTSGVRHIRGDIVGDASAFDDQRVPAGWRRRYLQASYAARVSALSINENIAHVVVRSTGRGATVEFEEPVAGIPIHSTVTVREGSRRAYIRVWQDTTNDRFRVHGWIGSMSPARTYQVVVEQPEQFAAAAFRAALERRGIAISGEVRVARTPAASERVTMWASAPLAQLVATMNGESNNHFAELLFRNAARSQRGIGSAEAANDALQEFLEDRVGVEKDAVFAADGSGLSTLDRVTARSMVQLLSYAHDAPWGAVYRTTLPIAGQTETLKGRMRQTPAQGNLHAKTGTTNDVNSLGGYVTARNGEVLAFAFIYNGRSLARAREVIDAMGVTLAGFSR
jgi:D-alanyl-D-alanine carboxypeptidase/D-alanyl-D-alanine-endopeptidase (penicillin-binding protein 4)